MGFFRASDWLPENTTLKRSTRVGKKVDKGGKKVDKDVKKLEGDITMRFVWEKSRDLAKSP